MSSKQQTLIDIIQCNKCRVFVAQIGDVDDDKIEEAAAQLRANLSGAGVSIHTIGIEPGARYKSTIDFDLVEVAAPPVEETSEGTAETVEDVVVDGETVDASEIETNEETAQDDETSEEGDAQE